MKCFYINLDHRIDRRTSMEDQLQKKFKTIPYERFDAFKGDNETLLQLCNQGVLSPENYIRVLSGSSSFLTRGAVGCFLSHLELFRYSVRENIILIVLEDDVQIVDDFEDFLSIALGSIDHDFNIIYLGQPLNQWRPNSRHENDFFWEIRDGYHGTFGYVIHPAYSKFLMDHLFRVDNHIDNMMLQLNTIYNIKVLLFKDALVYTDATPSRNSDVALNKRAKRYKSFFIPWNIFILDPSCAKNIRFYNPRFKIILKPNMDEVLREIDTNGGFFIDARATFKYSIQDFIHNVDYVSIHDNEHLFFGRSGKLPRLSLLLPKELFKIEGPITCDDDTDTRLRQRTTSPGQDIDENSGQN